MKDLFLIAVVLASAFGLGGVAPGWAHAGSSSPVPRGCHILVEKILIDGVEIALRRLSCPAPKAPATS